MRIGISPANIGLFHAVIEEMSHVDYYNIAAQHLYGMKDIGRYFTSRLERVPRSVEPAKKRYDPKAL